MASAKYIVKLIIYILAVFCFIACSEMIEDGIFESGNIITVRSEISSQTRAGYEGSEVLPSHFYMDVIQGGSGRFDYSLVKMTKEEASNIYQAPSDKLLLWADSEGQHNASIKALTLPYNLDEIDPENPMKISVCTDQTSEENVMASDLLGATSDKGIVIEGDDIKIMFNHLTTKLDVSYRFSNEGAAESMKINSFTLRNVCVGGGFSYAEMDYDNSVAKGFGNIDMCHNNASNSAEAVFYPYIPETDPILVVYVSVDGKVKELTCPVRLKSKDGFIAGKRYKMSIEISGSAITNASINIVKDWDEENDDIKPLIGEKILWIGTSIPSGDKTIAPDNNYPKMVADALECTIINNARPSSFVVWDPICTWTTSAEVESAFPMGYCLSATKAEIRTKFYDVLENIRKKEGKSTSWRDKWMNEFLDHSYESLIIPYIDGTIDNCTTLILDHGFNDRHSIVYECTHHWATKVNENGVLLPAEDVIGYTWLKSLAEGKISRESYLEDCAIKGFTRNSYLYAMTYIINECLKINPGLRIIIGNYFAWKTPVFEAEFKALANDLGEDSNDFCSLLCGANEAVAGMWGLDIVNVYKYTWIMNTVINDENDFMKFCPDGTHPFSDLTGESNRIIADIYVKELSRIFGLN